jgi:hypothetical protein
MPDDPSQHVQILKDRFHTADADELAKHATEMQLWNAYPSRDYIFKNMAYFKKLIEATGSQVYMPDLNTFGPNAETFRMEFHNELLEFQNKRQRTDP